jgi:serine/threonine-protein kinase
VNPEAYEAYLRGLHSITTESSTAQQIRVAQHYFEESIRKDPGFALAYVRLADCYVSLGGYRALSPEGAYGSAKEALRRALELDGSLGEAHSTLATLSWWHDWDWAAAEREFNLAVELAPSYAWGHSSRSAFLAWSGRRAEALAEIIKAREIDPGYSSAACESANYFQLRDYEGLMEVSRRGIVSDPNEWLEPYFLGVAYEGLGRRSEAIPEYQKAIEMSKGDQDPVAALAHAYAVVGRRTEAETMLRDLQRRSSEGYVSPYMIATIYAGLDNKDRAFEFLEKARQERCWDIAWQIKVDLRLDNLRSDPRFQALLRRVGMSQ